MHEQSNIHEEKKRTRDFFRIKKSVDKGLKNKVSYACGSKIINLNNELDLFLFTILLILNIGNFVNPSFKSNLIAFRTFSIQSSFSFKSQLF